MGEQTTISVSQETKDELEEGKEKPWGPHLLDLKRNETKTVRLSEEQMNMIAKASASYVLLALSNGNGN